MYSYLEWNTNKQSPTHSLYQESQKPYNVLLLTGNYSIWY